MKKENKKSLKAVYIIACLCLAVCVAVIGVFSFNTIRDSNENNNIINRAVKIPENISEEDEDQQTGSSNEDGEFSVDWDYLKKENKDIVAWIYIPGTNINYPVLQGKNNNTYLRKNMYHKYSYQGSIFVEQLNKNPFTDFNTIIYGHNLENGKMFSQLKKYKKQSYYNKHKYIYIYTPDGNCTRYLIFSFHRVSETNYDVFNLNYSSFDECKSAFTKNNMIKADDFEENDVKNVITLSTCDNSRKAQRYVLHACSF